jgi:Sulfotransferase family
VSQDKEEMQAGEEPSARDLERALRPRRENVEPVDQPLALICQAQRSGGTLLARLFDGHPQCHAHPHELLIGYPKAHTWPQLPLDETPEVWFAKLKEGYLSTLYVKGRRKIPLKAADEKSKGSYPFILPPTFQRQVFLEEVERRAPITSERQVLDCYMTSLFNAWLDNQNLRGAEKRWVVAFSPRRAWGAGLEKHFDLYPDGRLISILRDPLSWYASAQGRDPEADASGQLDIWQRSAQEIIEADRLYGERVCIVRFDELLLDTPGTMRRLADFLEIDFVPQLTVPTFNGYPVGANSSYKERRTGVVTDPVKRYKKVLTGEQQEFVREECEELYQEALALTERQAERGGMVAVEDS